MYDGVERVAHDRQVGREGAEDGVEPLLRALGHAAPGLVALDAQPALSEILVAEAAHLDVHDLRQLTGEVLDVHARAAVDVGRVLAGDEADLGRGTVGAGMPIQEFTVLAPTCRTLECQQCR